MLSPFDNLICDRKRTKLLFDFEYIREVYKPADQRRWGYYTLPILWHDRLVARIDPKLERASGTLTINGFWLEDEATGGDQEFAAALCRGLVRFMRYLDAGAVALGAIQAASLRGEIERVVAASGLRLAQVDAGGADA